MPTSGRPPNRSPRPRKRVRGCIYARFSTRFQQSLDDQVRACREWAERHDVEVADDHVFTDAAASGKRRRRPGLDAMKAALERGTAQVVITYATNRLHRKIHLALKFVEEVIVERRRRCVFVAQDIDTANEQFWKQLIYVFAMLDEFGIMMTAGHVREAHVGLLQRRLVHGTLTYGYAGTPAGTGETTRRGRPRRHLAVDEAARPWVTRVFEWYVHERRPFAWIARELRRRGAPPPPKVPTWSGRAVKYLLMNRRYVGDWSYGWRETVWQSKGDYPRQYLKEIPTHAHSAEHLRIVDDRVFHAAQELLAKKQGRGGRPCHRGTPAVRDVLAEVCRCPKHDRPLRVSGAGGRHLSCPACKREEPAEQCLFSVLNRQLTRRLLFERLAELLLADTALVDEAVAAATRLAERAQRPDPARLDGLERELRSVAQRINFILDNPGESAEDRTENSDRLASLRARRGTLQSELSAARTAASAPVRVPTPEELRRIVDQLSEALTRAADGGDPEEVGAVTRIVIEMTGGRIDLSQQGEPRHHGGWLRGTFRLRPLRAMLARCGVDAADESAAAETAVTIDFREPDQAEALAEEAKTLYDQGLLFKRIAERLSEGRQRPVTRNAVAKAIAHWFSSRGLPCPDGRGRRADLKRPRP